MQKLKELLFDMNPRVVMTIGAALLVIAVLPGFIGSQRSEESTLSPQMRFEAPPSKIQGEEAELLQWAAAEGDDYAPPASISNASRNGTSAAIEDDEALDCIIEPYEIADVGSALSAVVNEVLVQRSERVTTGQVLAKLDASVEMAALDVAGARARMIGNLRARDARAELGRQRAGCAQNLYGERVVSKEIEDEALAEAVLAEAELAHAKELRMLNDLERKQAERLVERRTIRSPIDGVVIERLKGPGEVVNEETLFTVAQLDPLRVHVILPAAMYGSVIKDMKAEVWPELSSTGVQLAQVEIVDRVIDAGSGTFGVQLRLPNSDYALPSGLRCRVQFLREVGGS
jgi:RND family efflux transporter MFP subunit